MTWPMRHPRSERSKAHERARALAAERLDGPLDADQERWLETHLAECEPCRLVADEYTEQRALLRTLTAPVPPRDLWARTAAAIELEAEPARAGSAPLLHRLRPPAVPLGVLSGILVVAVVVGATLLTTPGTIPRPSSGPDIAAKSPTPVPSPIGPTATPISVAAVVGWVEAAEDGTFTLHYGSVDRVCPAAARPDCAPIQEGLSQVLSLDQAPRAIVQSPSDGQIVVVDEGTKTEGGEVLVVAVPTPEPSIDTSATPSPPPSADASPSLPSPTASSQPSVEPTASAAPTTSVEPSPTASVEPTVDPSPTIDPGTPSPSAAATLAIISDVVVVGESAAYSPDGQWFAFTARPADGSHGPDIYVWNPSLTKAEPVTTDHRSIFSSWVGSRMVGSTAETSGADLVATSFLLDPSTRQADASGAPELWLPIVDPRERWALGWEGTLATADGLTIAPGTGRLVIASWDPAGPGLGNGPKRDVVVVAEGPIGEWDARWDESGRRLAVWIADSADPSVGKLSLFEVNPGTGRIDEDKVPLRNELALPGFTIGDGHLAWVTPPGADGQGSQIEVFAWAGESAGQVTGEPNSGTLIVAR